MLNAQSDTRTPLKLARVTRGIPQFVIAKRARLQPSRLSVLERGYDEASAYERAALSRVLGVPAEQLFPLPEPDDAPSAAPAGNPSASAQAPAAVPTTH